MKVVKFIWRELVWDEYRCEYTEKEWLELQEWSKNNVERQRGSAAESYATARYNFIKQFTFEDVCDILLGEKDDPVFTYTVNTDGRDWSYDEYLTDMFKECLRDDAFNRGVADSWNANDYDEEVYVAFADEKEKYMYECEDDDDLYDEDEDDYNPFVNDVEIC